MNIEEEIVKAETKAIRNVCVLAHVDHGKTTLCDRLISFNGIISTKSAGQLRFLDSREDEQRRLITIVSSAITLKYENLKRADCSKAPTYINLIDSPGHVDFLSEVCAAVRLSDGALLLIDAVEGVGSQTKAVLRQAWLEKCKVVVVLSKLDRLIRELKMSPLDAYKHLRHIVEKINAIVQQLNCEDKMETDKGHRLLGFSDALEEELEFSPIKENVLFISSLDGWCLNLKSFANMVIPKMNLPDHAKKHKLLKCFWGNHYLNTDNFTVTQTPPKQNSLPIIVKYVLTPIWNLYHAKDYSNVASSLNIPGPITDLQSILTQWLPIPETLMQVISDMLPSPLGFGDRMGVICPDMKAESMIYKDLLSCQGDSIVVFIAKFVSVELDLMRITGDRISSGMEHSLNQFLAIGRIFSGIVKKGDSLYVVLKACKSNSGTLTQEKVKIEKVVLLMGQDLLEVSEGRVGMVVGLVLKGSEVEEGFLCAIDKCVTLVSSNVYSDTNVVCLSSPYRAVSSGIVRVCIEPVNISDMSRFLQGLELLRRSDPAVKIEVLSNGDHLIGCAGEIHMERCVSDMRELYARIDLRVSDPIISVCETLVYPGFPNLKICLLDSSEPFRLPWCNRQRTDANVNVGGLICTKSLKKVTKSKNKKKKQAKGLMTESCEYFNPTKYEDEDEQEEEADDEEKAVDETLNNTWTEEQKAQKFYQEYANMEWEEVQRRLDLEDSIHFIDPPNNNFSAPKNVTDILQENFSKTTDDNKTEIDIDSTNNGDTQDNTKNYNDNYSSTNDNKNDDNDDNNSPQKPKDKDNTPNKEISFEIKAKPINPIVLDFLTKQYNIDYNTEIDVKLKDKINKIDSTLSNLLAISPTHPNILRCHDNVFLKVGATIIKAIVLGFQRACLSGPLAEEPVRGVEFVVEKVIINEHMAESSDGLLSGSLFGQVISIARESFRSSLIQRGCMRIVEPMLRIELECEQAFLGGTYSVLAKRRAQIKNEMLRDGGSVFLIEALIPMMESIGIPLELRSKASGHVAFHQQFSHWAVLEEDPFPEASLTPEEIEEGSLTLRCFDNEARRIINQVRKRKGLINEEKVIVAAEKQRTLTKNK